MSTGADPRRPALGGHGPWLLALVGAGLAAGYLGFMLPGAVRVQLWLHGSVWLVGATLLLTFLLLGYELLRAMRSRRERSARWPDLVAIGLVLAAALSLLGQVPHEMRIQADESALVGTSFGLHLGAGPVVPAAGWYDVQGNLHPLSLMPDKRGLLFPLALWGMHGALGYSADNGLLLNALLTLLVPVLVYLGLRRGMGAPVACAGALLALAHPVLIWCGASSGFEIVNVVVLLAAWLAVEAGIASGAPRHWLLAALLGALASQARYESTLFGAALLALAVVACLRRPARRFNLAFALVPLLYLPFAWQRAIPFDFGQGELGDTPAFSASYLGPNLLHALSLLSLPSPIEPLSPLPLMLAMLLLPALRPPQRIDQQDAWGARTALVGAALAMLAAILAYVWGDLSHPFTMRFGLPLALLLSILAAHGANRYCRRSAARGWIAAGVALALLAATVPAVRFDSAGRRQAAGMALNEAVRWARAAAPRCRPLFVERFSNFFVAEGYASVPGTALAQVWPDVRSWVGAGSIDAVWFVEISQVVAGKVTPIEPPPAGFAERQVHAASLPGDIGVRILALDRPGEPLGADCAPAVADPVSSS